jgi:hypothetical protein
LDGEINVHRAQGANETVFECFDGAFSCVDLMVAWLDK